MDIALPHSLSKSAKWTSRYFNTLRCIFNDYVSPIIEPELQCSQTALESLNAMISFAVSSELFIVTLDVGYVLGIGNACYYLFYDTETDREIYRYCSNKCVAKMSVGGTHSGRGISRLWKGGHELGDDSR